MSPAHIPMVECRTTSATLTTSHPESPRCVSAIENEQKLTKTKRKKTKQVRFRLDESSLYEEDNVSGRVLCDYAPPRDELTPEETELLYWTKKQFKTFKKESKKLARTTDEENIHHHRTYLKTFMDIYTNPPQEDSKVGIVHQRNATCLPLATASVRGLERYIFPGLLQDQSRVKESVLKAQAKLVSQDSMTPSQRAFVLASTSTILSRQSRHVARVMGHADSILALSIYKQTFLPKTKDKGKAKHKSSSKGNAPSDNSSSD